MKLENKMVLVWILILSIALTACVQNNNDINDNTEGINGEDGKDDQNNDNDNIVPANPNQDIDLTKKLLEDKEVSGGQIYIRDEWAIGAIILNDDVNEERAQEIAQQYAEQIKEKYRDKKVNVQVILNGKNVINLEL